MHPTNELFAKKIVYTLGKAPEEITNEIISQKYKTKKEAERESYEKLCKIIFNDNKALVRAKTTLRLVRTVQLSR